MVLGVFPLRVEVSLCSAVAPTKDIGAVRSWFFIVIIDMATGLPFV